MDEDNGQAEIEKWAKVEDKRLGGGEGGAVPRFIEASGITMPGGDTEVMEGVGS